MSIFDLITAKLRKKIKKVSGIYIIFATEIFFILKENGL